MSLSSLALTLCSASLWVPTPALKTPRLPCFWAALILQGSQTDSGASPDLSLSPKGQTLSGPSPDLAKANLTSAHLHTICARESAGRMGWGLPYLQSSLPEPTFPASSLEGGWHFPLMHFSEDAS